PWLESVVLTALAKSPEERFASADQLCAALAQGPAWAGPYPATDRGTATGVDGAWTRPVPIGAEQRRDRPTTRSDPAEPWAPTGAMGATPTDRGRLDPGDPGWSQPLGD